MKSRKEQSKTIKLGGLQHGSQHTPHIEVGKDAILLCRSLGGTILKKASIGSSLICSCVASSPAVYLDLASISYPIVAAVTLK